MEPARAGAARSNSSTSGSTCPNRRSRSEPSDVAASGRCRTRGAVKYSVAWWGWTPAPSTIRCGGPDRCGGGGRRCGMVRYLGPAPVANRVIDRFPNVVAAPGRVQALVVGSGWGDRVDAGAIQRAVDSGLPLVVDADGLRHLPSWGHAGVLLTPHSGELARLLGCPRDEVEADPLSAVRAAVSRTGCTVLLKGATQYVATVGSDRVWLAVPGAGWTAQAGSGDVLAGTADAAAAGLGGRGHAAEPHQPSRPENAGPGGAAGLLPIADLLAFGRRRWWCQAAVVPPQWDIERSSAGPPHAATEDASCRTLAQHPGAPAGWRRAAVSASRHRR